jgi:crotonobetainyl-CoA:carnitine CoA-transferase CaiB-like acyl-CoA transferase
VSSGPCEGLRVVEVAVGVSDLGLGLAGGVPGMLLAELGAEVTRVVSAEPVEIDRGLSWSRVWHRHKHIVQTDDAAEVRRLLADADVALVYGPEELVEGRGLSWAALAEEHPSLVLVRCRPSHNATGPMPDFGLLVEARSGFCTQLEGHRPGPIFVDVRAPGSGAAFLMAASALALLHRRELTGEGGWAETSLYDGMLATLGCMIGRSEHGPADVEGYWRDGSTFPNFLYRCADGELIQVWFGGKGMYPKLLAVLGDEPSEQGYYADQVSGQLQARARRWNDLFRARTRDEWIALLRAEGVACEPVNGPGDALADNHLAEIGLAREEGGDLVLGTPIAVESLADPVDDAPTRPLAGLRVVDFSAFVAGPLGAQVLADLGADVIKVEPPTGEAMRAAAYAVAACQRGKRSLALDMGATEARPAVEGLLRWADVVLHNFRVGVAERLGIGADRVAELRSDAVYCHASGFGPTGPRAKLPGNDALMQAVTGFEVAVGGEGNDPIAGTWIPIDMAGGWVAAIGMLAGCYARARTGAGQKVDTSLLGAGMLLQSGTFQSGGAVVRGPALDREQTGYGPGHRLYPTADGTWLAVVVPDADAWRSLGDTIGADLPAYAPLRAGRGAAAAVEAERAIAEALATKPGGEWLGPLRDAGVLVEVVHEQSRDQFRSGILDDEINRRLGRVATYETADWGRLEQIGPLLRHGPAPWPGAPLMLPGVGEHTVEVLRLVGLDDDAIDALLEAGIAVQQGR